MGEPGWVNGLLLPAVPAGLRENTAGKAFGSAGTSLVSQRAAVPLVPPCSVAQQDAETLPHHLGGAAKAFLKPGPRLCCAQQWHQGLLHPVPPQVPKAPWAPRRDRLQVGQDLLLRLSLPDLSLSRPKKMHLYCSASLLLRTFVARHLYFSASLLLLLQPSCVDGSSSTNRLSRG